MALLDLPAEILQQILLECFVNRGWKRVLRLRLVNKLFAAEVLGMIYTHDLLDGYFQSLSGNSAQARPPYIAGYMAYRASKEPVDGMVNLVTIREVTQRISRELNLELDRETTCNRECMVTLCSQVARGSYSLASIFDKSTVRPNDGDLALHLLAAAAFMNLLQLSTKMVEQKCPFERTSSLFGNPVQHALRHGSLDMVKLFPRVYSNSNHLHEAARNGSFDCFKHLYDIDTVNFAAHGTPNPWRFEYSSSIDRRSSALETWLFTPSIDVFKYVMEIRQTSEEWKGPLNEGLLARLMTNYAATGKATMARYILHEHNAPVDVLALWKKHTPLLRACHNGQTEMVQLLINLGAKTKGAVELAAAGGHEQTVRTLLDHGAEVSGAVLSNPAKLGRISMVRLLLDNGADPNEGSPNALVTAIALEHKAMFNLLLERGAVLSKEVGEECVKRAKADGLESMLVFLEEIGVDIVTTWLGSHDFLL
ncbi:ankyrin repeat-containing domain protein [Massariosphaeria phaeospora]|uniref:Ankyrin repeat-containing domain protein n=1 Tax=Massariosphaeria phaeospora TaxID=100035 RepID=A0A7C8MEW8_9PLEO|nr:ankyrin repeat-containing domain protein [Massariosphaeria phaeospora]